MKRTHSAVPPFIPRRAIAFVKELERMGYAVTVRPTRGAQ